VSGLKRVLAAAIVLGLGIPAGASAQAPTLERLLERFSELPGLEARYREEKRIALLAVPTRSEGRIWFANPGRLLRRQRSPEEATALIADGRLRFSQGDRVEELSIEDNPVLRGFVDSFRAVLAGDREALERYYDAELTPRPDDGAQAWTLTLIPRNEALARFLRRIVMRGEGVTISEMRMVEVNGDETRTEFFDVNTDRRYSPGEARRLFRVE
jgi:outer membrane lipoprotein-sorting protein